MNTLRTRGQVALFVVIGLVALILILLLLFFRRPQTTAQQSATVAPVDQLVTDCVSQALEQLLRQAGGNGGYLDTSRLLHSPDPQQGDTVQFPPQDVPYWSHVKRCGQSTLGCAASEQPPLCKDGASTCPFDSFGKDSVQEQVEDALPAATLRCLDNFTLLSDQYSVQQKGTASASVLFASGKTMATVTMPLLVTDLSTGKSTLLSQFSGSADVDIPRIYRLANELADAERNTSFLERLTLHLISIYSGVGEALPPMRAVTLLGQKTYWSRTQVQQSLQDDVLPWVDFIQVPNALAGFAPIWPSGADAAGLTPEEQTMYAGVFSYLYVHPNNETYPDMKARFFYPGTTPYLSINGGQELLKPRSADLGGLMSKLVGLFMNDYRFSYDLSYPVIVTLTDESAFGGKGYDWSFALQANIWHNEPLNTSAAASAFTLTDASVDLSAPQQAVDNTINITATDRLTGQPLGGVRISYQCGQEYFVGETGDDGSLVTQLPYCRYGGALLYSKEGYLGSGTDYDNYEENITKAFGFALWPLRNVTISVRKRSPDDIAALQATTPTYDTIAKRSENLSKNDLVIVNIARIKESPYDEDQPLVGFFTLSTQNQTMGLDLAARKAELQTLKDRGVLTDQDVQDYLAALNQSNGTLLSPEQPNVTLQLAPGEYTIDAYLLHTKPLEIPEETSAFCLAGGGSTCIGKQTMTLPATNFSSWLAGGASLNESQPWQLPQNILYAHGSYTLYVLEQPLPASWHDLESYQTPDDFLQDKRILEIPTNN